jgi:ATP-binding cassette subfamily C protein CydC
MDEIVQAARLAHIHDFIEGLPQSYHTWVGEHGLHLSAGERQRIAVARELLIDAPLLVLDEATANLDALTERALLTSIREAMLGRSLLVITHRLVGMEGFDEILVMDRGRVAERGRHAELLAAGGLYWRMWQAQQRV